LINSKSQITNSKQITISNDQKLKLTQQTIIMRALSTKELKKLEEKARHLGLEERILIENASSNLANIIDNLKLGKNALAVSGKGNNGADSLACARKLLSRGYNVAALILKEKEPSREVIFQKEILKKAKIHVYSVGENNLNELEILLKRVDFIIDGILGIGIKGEVSLFLKKVIQLINNSKKIVVACDIPSGLSPDEGTILGEAIKADYTVTFIAPKRGFFLKEGPKLCGKIFVADIGISRQVLEHK